MIYNEQKADSGIPLARHGANTSYFSPIESYGSLDVDRLKKLRLTAANVRDDADLSDDFFFHQIELYICDTNKLEVEDYGKT